MELLDAILHQGGTPVVIDSQTLLGDPAGVLAAVCERLGLAFDEAMLSWPPGPKPEDGVWGRPWYTRLHETTGFEPYQPKTEPLPPELDGIYAECAPRYERLSEYAIKA